MWRPTCYHHAKIHPTPCASINDFKNTRVQSWKGCLGPATPTMSWGNFWLSRLAIRQNVSSSSTIGNRPSMNFALMPLPKLFVNIEFFTSTRPSSVSTTRPWPDTDKYCTKRHRKREIAFIHSIVYIMMICHPIFIISSKYTSHYGLSVLQPRNFSRCHSYLLTLVGALSATALLQHGIQFLLPLKIVLPYTVSSATSSLTP